jgi:hypothetical protein
VAAYFPLLYFGPTEYYRFLAREENPVWVINERYSKQTLRNRCSIYGANGKIQLSIPVERTRGKEILLCDAVISYVEPWQQIHWRSIKSAYGRTPYFEYFEHKFEALYSEETPLLVDFLQKANQIVLDILKVKAPDIYEGPIEVGIQKELDAQSEIGFYNSEAPYYQIFEDRHGYIPNLSILDWIFQCGPKIV